MKLSTHIVLLAAAAGLGAWYAVNNQKEVKQVIAKAKVVQKDLTDALARAAKQFEDAKVAVKDFVA